MIFVTASGSTYEYDEQNKRVRRLNGKTDITPRMGKDGEWRSVASILVQEGSSAFILWTQYCDPPPADGTFPTTVTSKVVEILKDVN